MSAVQSLSVVVPTKGCINKCGFCVSRMRNDDYPNIIGATPWAYTQNSADYLEKMAHAREKGCDTVILTGTGEPQQNKEFLTHFGYFLRLMEKPFRIVEMQTTGVGLDEAYLEFLRRHVKVNTLSLSLSALEDGKNAIYNGTPEKNQVNIHDLTKQIRQFGFNLRLSLNLTDYYKSLGNYSPRKLFEMVAKEFAPDQVTLQFSIHPRGILLKTSG